MKNNTKELNLLRIKFADKMKRRRMKAKMTQYRMAKTSGIPKSMIESIETGKQSFGIDTINRYLGALNLELGEFVEKK